MTNIIITVRTRRGFRKACFRGFVSSVPLSVNPSNGRDLDRSSEIADTYHGDKNGLNAYFTVLINVWVHGKLTEFPGTHLKP